MSNIHRRDLDNPNEDYTNDCALCLDPWPCPPSQKSQTNEEG